jgi:hypothetical protein
MPAGKEVKKVRVGTALRFPADGTHRLSGSAEMSLTPTPPKPRGTRELPSFKPTDSQNAGRTWEIVKLCLNSTGRGRHQSRPRERWRPPTQLQPRLPRHLNDLPTRRLTVEAILSRATRLTHNLKRSATLLARTLHKPMLRHRGTPLGERNCPYPAVEMSASTKKPDCDYYQRWAVVGRCLTIRPEAMANPPLLLQP